VIGHKDDGEANKEALLGGRSPLFVAATNYIVFAISQVKLSRLNSYQARHYRYRLRILYSTLNTPVSSRLTTSETFGVRSYCACNSGCAVEFTLVA